MQKILTLLNLTVGIDEETTDTPTSALPQTSMKSRRSSFLRRKNKRNSSDLPLKNGLIDVKICMGDKVRISTRNAKLIESKGTVMYIGYPFPNRGVRYGINLRNAEGNHDGCFMIDIKTGKVAKDAHIKKYKKRIKRRKYFKASTNHGIFVKKVEITCIERKSSTNERFTIEDEVFVRFRGLGVIKFIGTLQHTRETGIWYGIQLKQRKGRHDGTVNGIQYFRCAPLYGLHCRQSHLSLIESKEEEEDNVSIANIHKKHDTFTDDTQLKEYMKAQLNNPLPALSDKAQTSAKWAKVLGFPAKSELKLQINVPIYQKTDSISNTEPQTLRLVSVSQKYKLRNKQKYESLSNIIPPDVFRHNLSVNILLGDAKKASKSSLLERKASASASSASHKSIKRGATTVVLPGYYDGLKQRKFTDYYDFDEIEDQLGEGEFGVVYKCRKIDFEEDDDDFEFSTTIATRSMISKTSKFKSESISNLYPGDSDSSSDDDANNNTNKEIYAVKKIKKAKFHNLRHTQKQKAINLLQQEIKLLEKIKRLKKRGFEGSQYVMDLVDVFEDRNYLYIVTNYCAGGNLWSCIENNEAAASEAGIQKIMREILCGLVFLHGANMAHLDLKPDNIMFGSKHEIQLIDFGMSRVIPALQKARVLVGSPNFVAPEVIDGFYDRKADIWSCGVLFFMLRFGYPPFYISDEDDLNQEHKELYKLIKNGFSSEIKSGLGPWFPACAAADSAESETKISDNLADLISSMLDINTATRLTAEECLEHPYFASLADSKKLPLTVMNALTKFSGQNSFKVMISRLFAHQIEAAQLKELRAVWDKFDVKKDGSLNFAAFKAVMSEYDHGYKEYQIEAMFDSLDWNETQSINFNSLLTAFSYQRLVAVDERLWEAFAKLDEDNDGHITKAEIKRVLATVNPDGFDEGIKKLDLWQPEQSDDDTDIMPNIERRKKNISLWIGNCMIDADWDDDGQIDYEEFLRALHPRFNEDPVTPKGLANTNYTFNTNTVTPLDIDANLGNKPPSYFFEVSVASELKINVGHNNNNDTKKKQNHYDL